MPDEFNGKQYRVDQVALNGQLDRIEIKLERLTTVMLGVPDSDDKGVVGKVNATCDKVDKLSKSFWVLVGILGGSGALTGTTWAIINALS